MLKKLIFKDVIGAWILLAVSLFGGVALNEIRPQPQPLVYSSPEARLHETVGKGDHPSNPPILGEGDVDLDEMQKISSTRAALILDARPEVFYRLGHIPSALSLPPRRFRESISRDSIGAAGQPAEGRGGLLCWHGLPRQPDGGRRSSTPRVLPCSSLSWGVGRLGSGQFT